VKSEDAVTGAFVFSSDYMVVVFPFLTPQKLEVFLTRKAQADLHDFYHPVHRRWRYAGATCRIKA
jgi:hypothetical protein